MIVGKPPMVGDRYSTRWHVILAFVILRLCAHPTVETEVTFPAGVRFTDTPLGKL